MKKNLQTMEDSALSAWNEQRRSWGFTKDLTAVEVEWSDAVEIGFTEEGEPTRRNIKLIKVTYR
jgi:hypothetical protein